MNNIDLIPLAYRTRRWQARWTKRSAYLLGGFVAMLILGLSALAVATKNTKQRVEALQIRQTVTAQQRADLEQMGAEKAVLERQSHLLSGLRSGAAAEDMFLTIDRALTSNDVWFLDWQFQRAGVVVGEEVRTVNTGYFVVVPDGADQQAESDRRVQTNMSIQGQARDHSALSSFVRRLFKQPEIEDVRIRQTSLSRGSQRSIVEFDLKIVLNTDVRSD